MRRGNLVGFIFFARNFSETFGVLKDWGDLDYSDDGRIQIFLDNSELQIVTFLQRNLVDVYHSFVESLMHDCKKSRKAGNIPIVVKTFHGRLEDDYKHSMVPGLLIA